MVPVRAEVVEISQLSAHGGRSELLRWLSGFKSAPRQTFLVHGDPPALQSFKGAIEAQYSGRLQSPRTSRHSNLIRNRKFGNGNELQGGKA
jgi:metallo-beta-lactamase family protein